MVSIKVHKPWKGKVAIRDKYYWLALTKHEDISIQIDQDIMVIPFADIKESVVGKSEHKVKDAFSDEYHDLIYFTWKPTTLQNKLF